MVRIVKHVSDQGRVDFEFVGFDSWEDFDTLANILLTHMNAIVVDKLEGIYSKYWTFELDDFSFMLMNHEDTGNCLYPIQSSEEEFVFLNNLAHEMLPFIRES